MSDVPELVLQRHLGRISEKALIGEILGHRKPKHRGCVQYQTANGPAAVPGKLCRETILYGFFGLITTLVNLVTFIFLQDHQYWPYVAANAMAMILSLAVAFITNKYFVFQRRNFGLPVLCREFRDFVGARLLSVLFNMGVMYLLVSCLEAGKNAAKSGVSIVVIILNYLLSKLWVFKGK